MGEDGRRLGRRAAAVLEHASEPGEPAGEARGARAADDGVLRAGAPQRADALGRASRLIANDRGRHAASRIAVTPMPPAVHTEIKPRPRPRSRRSFASVARIRVPVAAKGWPTATLPPLLLSLPRSIDPMARSRPSRSRQNFSDSQAFSVTSVCAANASWIS